MLKFHENEKVILVIRKHWWVLARQTIAFIVLILIPPLALTFLPLAAQNFDPAVVEPIANFVLSVYIMILFIFFTLLWMDYYLDMWIITSERIIDIEQQGLFNREVSEIPLQSVEDVTIEIKGIIETFLKFGTIRIQTAGEREFTIDHAPDLYEAKDAILKHAKAQTR